MNKSESIKAVVLKTVCVILQQRMHEYTVDTCITWVKQQTIFP